METCRIRTIVGHKLSCHMFLTSVNSIHSKKPTDQHRFWVPRKPLNTKLGGILKFFEDPQIVLLYPTHSFFLLLFFFISPSTFFWEHVNGIFQIQAFNLQMEWIFNLQSLKTCQKKKKNPSISYLFDGFNHGWRSFWFDLISGRCM